MKPWLKMRIALAATVIAVILAAPAAAQMSGREKSFVEGLRKRSLLKLVDQYLKDTTKDGDALDVAEQQAELFEMQGARSSDPEQKAALFAKARGKYEELIKGRGEKLKAETDPRKQDELHIQILDLKVKLGELIWSREPGDDLNALELSDRQIGDRARVEMLMRQGGAVFQDVQKDATAWSQQMQTDPEMEKRYLNTGLYDKVALLSDYSAYRTAWTDYYLAYVVQDGNYNVALTGPGLKGPAVVKVLVDEVKMSPDAASAVVGATPKTVATNLAKDKAEALAKALQDAGATVEVQKEKEGLLKGAIDKFTDFSTKLDAKSQAKWDSLQMLGACYREQGLYEKAVESLRAALQGSPDEGFKIKVYYELVQTAVTANKFPEARAFMEELRSKHAAALPNSFIGSQLLPFLDAKIDLEEGRTDPEKKKRGLELMKAMWEKGQLVELVSAKVREYINRDNLAAMQPFELWMLADEAFVAKKYAEAQKYFEQFLKVTQANNPSHQAAIYNLAACYYRMAEAPDLTEDQQLVMMKEAARRFFEVASQFPKFQFVDRAAESYVLLRSEIHRVQPNDENLQAYDEALDWSIANRPEAAEKANMHWLSGKVKEARKDFLKAAQRFEKVSTDSPNFYEAKYKAIECYRSDLIEIKWSSVQAKELPELADKVAGKLEEYAKWAKTTAAKSEGEVASDLKEQGAQAMIWAAQILVQEQVAKYQRGLELLDQCEADFGKQAQFKGLIPRIKFSALFAQGQTQKAFDIIRGLTASGEDVSDLLQQMLASFTDEIELLVRQMRRDEARQKLAQADPIGDLFAVYLHERNQDARIPLVNYQLAELHKGAQDFDGPTGAIKRYLALIGFDPFEDPDMMEKKSVDVTHLAGLAECYQKAVEVQDEQRLTLLTRDPAKSYDYLKRAVFYWKTVGGAYSQRIPGMKQEEQDQAYWEAKLNELLCCYDLHALEQKFGKDPKVDYHEFIRGFIRNMRASGSKFGGPTMKTKFDRLAQKLGL